MFKTILFDLDGTLLPMDSEEFLGHYYALISPLFEHLTEPKKITEHLISACDTMIHDNRPELTNQDTFINDLLRRLNRSKPELTPIFDRFYGHYFNKLKAYTQPTGLARQICQTLLQKGYQLVLATNPIFPEPATQERMRWAGIADLPWALVTTYETSHFCKPNPGYYQEIIQNLRLNPEECLMVGNDTVKDLIAGKLGLQTYLITDCLTDQERWPYIPDYDGSLEQFYLFAQNLPVLKKTPN